MEEQSYDVFADETAPVEENPYEEPTQEKTEIMKCPSCGANMIWSAEQSCLICEYCGETVRIQTIVAAEQAFETLLQQTNSWEGETHAFRCDNCGAVEILDKNDISKKCSFCGTTNIVEVNELPGLKPTAVVPFKVTIENAIENVKRWAKKKLFAPRAFKKNVKPEEVRGVYNPAFTFDTRTYTRYSGTLGKYYYVTVRRNGKLVRERRVRYFTISGDWNMNFNDVLVQASTQISQKDIENLQPFGTDESQTYKPEFLSGYSATQYTQDGMQCWNTAKGMIESSIKRAILANYDHDVVSEFNYSTACSGITYKYVLLPVYVGHCNYRKKLYNFFVSGSNGKVTGKTPVSPIKVGLVVLAVVAVGVLIYLFQNGTIQI